MHSSQFDYFLYLSNLPKRQVVGLFTYLQLQQRYGSGKISQEIVETELDQFLYSKFVQHEKAINSGQGLFVGILVGKGLGSSRKLHGMPPFTYFVTNYLKSNGYTYNILNDYWGPSGWLKVGL